MKRALIIMLITILIIFTLPINIAFAVNGDVGHSANNNQYSGSASYGYESNSTQVKSEWKSAGDELYNKIKEIQKTVRQENGLDANGKLTDDGMQEMANRVMNDPTILQTSEAIKAAYTNDWWGGAWDGRSHESIAPVLDRLSNAAASNGGTSLSGGKLREETVNGHRALVQYGGPEGKAQKELRQISANNNSYLDTGFQGKETNPDGSTVEYQDNGDGTVTKVTKDAQGNVVSNETQAQNSDGTEAKEATIYQLPDRQSTTDGGEAGLDQVVEDANRFMGNATKKNYDEGKLKQFTGTLYNIMFALGVIAAVAVGVVIGIKIMLGGLEAKAEAKQILIPYIVGCVIIFGGFGIWKLVIELFQQL